MVTDETRNKNDSIEQVIKQDNMEWDMNKLCKTQNLDLMPFSGRLWEILKTTFWIATAIAC